MPCRSSSAAVFSALLSSLSYVPSSPPLHPLQSPTSFEWEGQTCKEHLHTHMYTTLKELALMAPTSLPVCSYISHVLECTFGKCIITYCISMHVALSLYAFFTAPCVCHIWSCSATKPSLQSKAYSMRSYPVQHATYTEWFIPHTGLELRVPGDYHCARM